MLHIILTIFKIIGILLLLIIGLLLAIILCVLFLPIRYYGIGKYNKAETNLRIKARYLFGIIRFNANLSENDRDISFKVFAKDMLKEKSSKKKKKAEKTKKAVNKSNAAIKESFSDEETLNTCSIADNSLNEVKAKKNENAREKAIDSTINSTTDSHITNGKKTDIVFKLKQFVNKVLNLKNKLKTFILSVISKLKHFLEKLRNINNRKNEYIEFLTDERSKAAIKEIKSLLGATLKHIRPTRVKGCISFGTGSPDTTGQLLGLISIFTSDYFKKLKLNADFDKEVLDIDINFKGRIRIINLVIVAIKLYKMDRLKEFISFVKQ